MQITEPDALFHATASWLAAAIRARKVSCVEVMEAHLQRIDAINPMVNAIVTLTAERALASARDADARFASGEPCGLLHGLPVAHKDLALTKGMRTTFGSPIFENFIPDQDALIVERLRAAGAIAVGKTNTPEFGAGSHTFNPVFGATRNPHALDRSSGGSSGGAAAALAAGLVPIADGSDLGGSLRNPAAFCSVVGLRPSPGRVPSWPTELAWNPLPVEGPMARTVEDVALMLAAMAGPDPRSPISIDERGDRFVEKLDRDFHGVQVAFSPNFGGLFPVERTVSNVVATAEPVLRGLGCVLSDTLPDFSGADDAFRVNRAWAFEQLCGRYLAEHRERMKETLVWNIECGRKLTGADLSRAEQARTGLYHRLRQFMMRHEFVVLPVTQVAPFPIEWEYPQDIDGTPMETYLDWMKSCYYITATGHPAISLPCGFTPDGLPVGLQIVGRHRDDFGVLQLAYAFQEATGFNSRRPDLSVGVCE